MGCPDVVNAELSYDEATNSPGVSCVVSVSHFSKGKNESKRNGETDDEERKQGRTLGRLRLARNSRNEMLSRICYVRARD